MSENEWKMHENAWKWLKGMRQGAEIIKLSKEKPNEREELNLRKWKSLWILNVENWSGRFGVGDLNYENVWNEWQTHQEFDQLIKFVATHMSNGCLKLFHISRSTLRKIWMHFNVFFL